MAFFTHAFSQQTMSISPRIRGFLCMHPQNSRVSPNADWALTETCFQFMLEKNVWGSINTFSCYKLYKFIFQTRYLWTLVMQLQTMCKIHCFVRLLGHLTSLGFFNGQGRPLLVLGQDEASGWALRLSWGWDVGLGQDKGGSGASSIWPLSLDWRCSWPIHPIPSSH